MNPLEGSGMRQRLAAILAADAAGYSRLMSIDDKATVAALDAARAVFRTHIKAQQGRVIDMAGDSVLAVFDTASGAVTAALEAQRQLEALAAHVPAERRMRFRIGIHLGDVIEKADGTVYGDGVNIAARLEGLAEPGGITVSESIRSAVKGKVDASFEDQGEQAVKNIADPVRAWRVRAVAAASTATAVPATAPAAARPRVEVDPSLPDKPSIAVLPFSNISGDPEQAYFADGITEDIITELSRFHSLFVIARNSSFTYKGKAADVRTVAKELGVRYVLEGSIRKSADRIRATAQLIDALTGAHIWAEKYDRVLADIFDLQEELTRSIVMAIAPHIEAVELHGILRRQSQNLGVYEKSVSAWAKAWSAYLHSDVRLRDKGLAEALAEAEAALAIDSRSSRAWHVKAFVHWRRYYLGAAPDRTAAWQAGMSAATAAIEIDRNDCDAYALKALLLTVPADARLAAQALPCAQRAYELNPNNMTALAAIAFSELGAGLAEEACVHLHQALRLSPRDPLRQELYLMLATASLFAGEYADGVEYALLGITEAPQMPALHGYLAMNLIGLGDIAKAKEALDTERQLAPAWTERILGGGSIFGKPVQRRRITTFLRVAAGLEDPSAADALR